MNYNDFTAPITLFNASFELDRVSIFLGAIVAIVGIFVYNPATILQRVHGLIGLTHNVMISLTRLSEIVAQVATPNNAYRYIRQLRHLRDWVIPVLRRDTMLLLEQLSPDSPLFNQLAGVLGTLDEANVIIFNTLSQYLCF